jgi:GT2 family glycosyltransferase
MAMQPINRPLPETWHAPQDELNERALRFGIRNQLMGHLQRRWDLPLHNRVASHLYAAKRLLKNWLRNGWLRNGNPSSDLSRLHDLARGCPPADPWLAPGANVSIQVRGGNLSQWPTHAWLQHCPIEMEPGGTLEAHPFGSPNTSPIALNLGDVKPGLNHDADLLQLASLERVWDPDPERVQLLQLLGINASCLTRSRSSNGYLHPTTHTWEVVGQQLGLPAPYLLSKLGRCLCLGSGGPDLDRQLAPPLLGIPGFNWLVVDTPQQGRLLAQWLQSCLEAGLDIVRFEETPPERSLKGWHALVQPEREGRAPILLLEASIQADELLQELDWYRQGCPSQLPGLTPQPNQTLLFESGQPNQGQLAVCVSLYNYADRIIEALNSVLDQRSIAPIELIVVDDASTDHGALVVQAWMDEHQSRFGRCLLLQHTSNSGLASARNTAFGIASSPWCFVLDADNALDPLALCHCGALAAASDPRCAVIHSLVRVRSERGRDDSRVLVSDHPWQESHFLNGNYIDAMALVRREAWQEVGGYSHIPGGWEDFDFWCSLVDAGWHGLLCPQVLATYNSHQDSMSGTTTNHQTRRISRILQARHPWLDLRHCHARAIWPTTS